MPSNTAARGRLVALARAYLRRSLRNRDHGRRVDKRRLNLLGPPSPRQCNRLAHADAVFLGNPTLDERSARRFTRLNPNKRRRLSVEKSDAIVAIEPHDEDVRQLDQCPVAPRE